MDATLHSTCIELTPRCPLCPADAKPTRTLTVGLDIPVCVACDGALRTLLAGPQGAALRRALAREVVAAHRALIADFGAPRAG